MLKEPERLEIARLWERKLHQDAQGVPQAERHRNLEPVSAEFLCSFAVGIEAKRIVEVGGSSGISTIALAAAAREVSGHVISVEREPNRQADSRKTLSSLDLDKYVEFILADASSILPGLGEVNLALIDCEKEDYIRFFDMLRVTNSGFIIADNILSHSLTDYVAHVHSKAGLASITLPIGKGLELTRVSSQE